MAIRANYCTRTAGTHAHTEFVGWVVLETDRLVLEPWSARYTGLLLRLSSLEPVVRHVGDGRPWPPRQAREVSEFEAAHWRAHGFGWRAAIERETGGAVGFIALNLLGEGTAGLDPDEHEIGWWLDPGAWGRGLAREGAAALRDEAFERVGAASVVARIQPENAASVRVAEAIGMSFEFETAGGCGERIAVYRGAPKR